MRWTGGRRTRRVMATSAFAGTLAACPNIAVFQPRPGLGDLIWHLPHIRAIAASGPSGQITLITKRSTQADRLLQQDRAIGRIVWFERNPRDGRGRHDGIFGFARLVADLRSCRAEACILLHHGASLAAAMRLAAIPHRFGYGYGAQRRWLNRPPFLGPEVRTSEAFDQATEFARLAGLPPLDEPEVTVAPAARAAVADRIAGWPVPMAVLGIGSHGTIRQWGAARFAELARRLLADGIGCVVLVAAQQEAPMVADIRARLAGSSAVHAAIGWDLQELAALLARADLFVGNDSGPMNLSAAVGRVTFALFGASGPLRHSAHVRPIVPPGGPRAGMDQISVDQVCAALRTWIHGRP